MKIKSMLVSLALFPSFTLNIPAATRCVNVSNPLPAAPYTSWATAATNIQDAIDVALAGDLILVTNGVYATGSSTYYRVSVNKPVTVQSVNGSAATIIEGQLSVLMCAYLTNGAVLCGFTLTNGLRGVTCESTNALIINCTLAGNSLNGPGGGVYSGTLSNCVLRDNYASWWGGGAEASTLNGCTLTANSSFFSGGGAHACQLNNCTLSGNVATAADRGNWSRGGGVSDSTLNNCLLTGNSAHLGGGAYGGTLNNCTLAGNAAYTIAGDIDGMGGGAYGSGLNNCIVYYNSAYIEPNDSACTLNYCCTPNSSPAPLFVDQAGGNLRLQSNSPCINVGSYSLVSGFTDLDGRSRIVGSKVDLGAYEFQPNTTGLFIGWLQQYGLATDGSADFADTDADHLNNWQEWRASTVPTNAASVLQMLAPSHIAGGLKLTWQSMTNRTYFLQRSTNLASQSAFSAVASNLVGQAGTTSFFDTNLPGAGPIYYRVGVQ